MLSTDILAAVIRGSGSLVHEATETFSDAEWTSRRVLPRTNPPGFTAWHMARTVDWAVNTGVRGQPEVAGQAGYQQMGLELGIGTGISAEEALAIAGRMPRSAVAEYAAAVVADALDWLTQVDEGLLVAPNRLETNQGASEVYTREGHLVEVRDLFGLPNWHLLMRPAGNHIRVHYGELELLGQVIAQRDGVGG